MNTAATVSTRASRLLLAATLVAVAVLWWRTAWLSDDSGISLRVVLNFISGLGPNFNPAERVQAFTHPLWFILLSAVIAVTGELYYSTLALSLLCTLAVVFVLCRGFQFSIRQQLLALVILFGSRAFVDYSSSGLENPLSHLLLLLFVVALYRATGTSTRRELALLGAAALVLLNRLDLALLMLPALLAAVWFERPWTRWLSPAALAALPLLAWFSFSLIYYGALFPNTAYAKLGSAVESAQLWRQGLHYLADSLQRDYVTLPAIVMALVAAVWRGNWRERSLALGIACYLLYIVSIGGDFMSGRFLSAPLLVAAVLSAKLCWRPATELALLFAVLVLASPRSIWLTGANFRDPQTSARGVGDERAFYYPNTGLRSGSPPAIQRGLAGLDWQYRGQRDVLQVYTLGLAGLKRGPETHVYDPLGLADPLVSRLPQGFGDNWRPGHFQRRLPAGLQESLQSGENRIVHPELAAYYEDIRLMTRAPIWDGRRWPAIWRVNTSTPAVLQHYNELAPEYLVPARPFYKTD